MLLVRSDGYHSNARYANDKTDLAPMIKDHGGRDPACRPIRNRSKNQIQKWSRDWNVRVSAYLYAPRPTDRRPTDPRRALSIPTWYRMFALWTEKYSTGQEESWKLCVLERKSLRLRIRWVYKKIVSAVHNTYARAFPPYPLIASNIEPSLFPHRHPHNL